MNSWFRHLPNALTFLRLVLIPVFVVLLINPSETMVLIATGVFAVAALTDYVDGLIARRWGVVSDFGKLLDPLADKILVMAALVMLVALRSDVDGAPWVPAWMVVLVLAREIWVTGLRGLAASQGIVVAASSAGKLKSLLQMFAIGFLLLHQHSILIGGIRLTAQLFGTNLLFVSIVISYWGATEYTYQILWNEDSSQEGDE